jgi:hypothetical protein
MSKKKTEISNALPTQLEEYVFLWHRPIIKAEIQSL